MSARGIDIALDQLRKTAEHDKGFTAVGDFAPKTPEQLLGLRFNRGDRVIDTHTGRKGVVQRAYRNVGERERVDVLLDGETLPRTRAASQVHPVKPQSVLSGGK